MSVQHEFSLHAPYYARHADLQRHIAQKLLARLPHDADRILDLGCGTGAVRTLYRGNIARFVGVDLAEGMCALHPRDAVTEVLQGDFDTEACWEAIDAHGPYGLILSASALQWSADPVALIGRIADRAPCFGVALFVAGTFATLHRQAEVAIALPETDTLLAALPTGIQWARERETLTFARGRDLLRFVKRLGFNGSGGKLDAAQIWQTAHAMDGAPVLEFEILYLWR